ncbi:MAG: zf-HC2 domain-containing protein [Bryobacteraceae bacterium]|nr:zf-HC2 domain-containing protein [Bryobacteraceae bacterium]
MTVTNNVVRDLMPLYLAGEVSEDTRRLVEEYLRVHPEELADAGTLALPQADPPPALEMASLERTRRLLSLRSLTLAGALAMSYAVFSFRFDDDGLSFVFYRDLPAATWVLLAAAACVWVAFLVLHRRWFATGLAGNTPTAKGTWMLIGALAMLPYAFVTSYRFGLDDVRTLCVVGAFAGLAIRQALHHGLAP